MACTLVFFVLLCFMNVQQFSCWESAFHASFNSKFLKKKINSELLKLFGFLIKCTQLYPWKKKHWLKDPKSSLISWITLTLIVDALWWQRFYFLLTLSFVSVIFATKSCIFLEWIFNTLNYLILKLLLESCTVAWTKLTWSV